MQKQINETFFRVAFVIRATDDAGNTADTSNAATANLFVVPPRIACVDEKGNPISSNPFEKPDDCSHFYQVFQTRGYVEDQKYKLEKKMRQD